MTNLFLFVYTLSTLAMSFIRRLLTAVSSITPVQGIIFFSFAIWMFCFRAFFFGEKTLVYDAVSYYDHTKFFIENLARGIFPLWDPVWFGGSPNAFFLMRIGPYNPFYGLIILFQSLGMPFGSAYVLFLAVYFFLGMIGFYWLALKLFKCQWTALCAFLLLTFSALGTRLFDSYLHLVFVPLIWFFLFLVYFVMQPRKFSLLGLIFCSMILLTTYIPFYFIVIVATFLISFVCVYGFLLKGILGRVWLFLKKHPVLVMLCVLAIIFSCLPGIHFFQEAKAGSFVLPQRYSTANIQNSLAVGDQSVKPWSLVEEIMYASFFTDLKRLHLKVLYLPAFFYILLALGCLTKFNRKMAFLLVWASLIFLIITPLAAPVYRVLYDHVFFFKYFRNLHFFLWFVLVQMAVLLVAEQFRVVADSLKAKSKMSLFALMVVLSGIIFYLKESQDVLPVTWGVVLVSFLFFLSLYRGFKRRVTWILGALLMLGVILEPVEAFRYFQKNETLYETFQYNRAYWKFEYTRGVARVEAPRTGSQEGGVYYGTQWFNLLWAKMNSDVFWEYYRHKFVVYDKVEFVDLKGLDIQSVEQTFKEKKNLAYVFDKKALEGMKVSSLSAEPLALFMEKPSESVKVLNFSANTLRIKTRFDHPKFLVYNDNFYPGWRVRINHKSAPLWQANVSFKGVWVPAGEGEVEFYFGSQKAHIQNYLLSFIFLLMLGGIVYFYFRERVLDSDFF